MTAIDALARAAGTWRGTNGFRLMPADDLFTAPATATVASAAGGHLVTLAYSWRHPDDGEQQGLLVLGHGDEGQGDEEQGEAVGPVDVTAFWADSWHQQAARTLDGAVVSVGSAGETLAFEYDYGGGWRWRVTVALSGDTLTLRMLNVVPASTDPSVGAYEAMVMDLSRA